MTKICPTCKKEFEPKRYNQVYCCTEHRLKINPKIAEERRNRRYNRNKGLHGNLLNDALAAKEAGMSYGEYMVAKEWN
mgnify:CR=1 FL=1